MIAMGESKEIEFCYYSPNEGRAVARFGTGSTIGATRGPSGYTINPDAVVPIPRTEVLRHSKEYADAVRHGDLRERTKADYEAFLEARRPKREEPAPEKQAEAEQAPEQQAEAPAPAQDDEAEERIATSDDIADIEADKAGGTEQ